MLAEKQLSLFPMEFNSAEQTREPTDLSGYDRFVVFFSGGKDSLACVLNLLEKGVPAAKIELHHHLVDGREGSELMDWPVTDSYCAAVANTLGTSYRTSWREGGFEREMNRTDQATAQVWIPSDDNLSHIAIGGDGPKGTRKKFPQVSANLSVRWCSSALKIDVGARYLTNHSSFNNDKTCVVTGERAQESSARAKYATFEPHRTDLRKGKRYKRHIDHWRAIHNWDEKDVWKIIERHRILPHPAYFLGFGRTSCRQCIFGSSNQWATVRKIAPQAFERIARYEADFGVTIHRFENVSQRSQKGRPYTTDPFWVEVANSRILTVPVRVDEWVLPSGAFAESCGPT